MARKLQLRSPRYAVAVIVETPEGIPLVLDPAKPAPQFWKFPGGRSKPGETAAEAAARELCEETGVDLPPGTFSAIHEEARGEAGQHHRFVLFHAKMTEPIALRERGDDGELVKWFTCAELERLPDFFPNHRVLFLSALRAGAMR